MQQDSPDQLQLGRVLGQGTRFTVHAVDGPAAESTLVGKVLRPECRTDARAAARLRQEAELLSRLVHPALARAHGLRELPEIGPVLLMDRIEGRTLRQVMEDGDELSESEVRRWGADLAGALATIHAAGWVHRDVKPENAVLREDGHAMLVDLETATTISSAIADAGDEFIGTPSHAAPEVRSLAPATPSSDVYSLGCCLHEALADRGHSWEDGSESLGEASLEPLASMQLGGEVSDVLAELVGQMLRADPAARPASSDVVETLSSAEASSWWQARQSFEPTSFEPHWWPTRPTSRDRFVGRESLLSTLLSGAKEAERGRGHAHVIEGIAGLGKSRLVSEFFKEAAARGVAVRGLAACHSQVRERRGAGPFGDAIVQLMGPSRLPEKLTAHLGWSRHDASSFAAFLSGRESPENVNAFDPSTQGGVTCALTRKLAEEAVTVWVIEDLHLATPASVGLAGMLVRHAVDERILVLITTRPELSADVREQVAALANLHWHHLEGLTDEEASELLKDRGRGERHQRESEVIRLGSGSPLMLESLQQVDFDTRSVSIDIQRVLRDKLEQLPAKARQTLCRAAVMGEMIDVGLLSGVGQDGRERVLEDLGLALRDTGFVEIDDGAWKFVHDLHRKAVLASFTSKEELELRLSLARAAERREREPDGAPSPVVFLLETYLDAGDDGGVARTVLLAMKALEYRSEPQRANELGKRAQALELDGELHVRLLLALARAALQLQRAKDCHSLLAEALDRAEALTAASLVVDVRMAIATAASSSGDLKSAKREFEAILPLVDQADRAAVESKLFGASMNLEPGAESIPRLEALLSGSACPARDRTIYARQLSDLLHIRGDFERCVEVLEPEIDHARRLGDGRGLANLLNAYGIALRETDEPDGSERALSEALELAVALGYSSMELMCRTFLPLLAWDEGRLNEGRDTLAKGLSVVTALGKPPGPFAVFHHQLAHQDLLLGKLVDARRRLEEHRGILEASGWVSFMSDYYTTMGWVAECESRPADAREHHVKAEGLKREMGQSTSLQLLCLGRLALLDGDETAARDYFERNVALASRHDRVSAFGPLVDACLASVGLKNPREVEVPATMPRLCAAESHHLLHRADGDAESLGRAFNIIDSIASRLTEQERKSFLEGNMVARRIIKDAGPILDA